MEISDVQNRRAVNIIWNAAHDYSFTPDFKAYVLPITLVILTGLFFIQHRGTDTVGLFFGPVMVGWFSVLGVLGALEISRHPSVLAALNVRKPTTRTEQLPLL